MNIIRKLLQRNKRHVLDGIAGYPLCPVTADEVWIAGPGGKRIYAHLHRPQAPGRYPGVVFVPGGGSAGTDYDDDSEITADDAAALGFTVLHYDPSGRGKTGGVEDYWGRGHQEELAHVIRYFAGHASTDNDHVGIVSFSIGIAISAGALARFPLPVAYLFDWEGPSNRFNITKNDTHKPLRAFPTSNDAFWSEREPVKFIPEITCGYFRYQADIDHMQGAYKRHAIELLNLATGGKSAWTKCNDNPFNTIFDGDRTGVYHWVSSRDDQKARILKYLVEVRNYEQTVRSAQREKGRM